MSDFRFLPNACYANMGDEPLDSGLKQARQSAFVFCPYLMLSAVLTKALVSWVFGVYILHAVSDSCRLLQEFFRIHWSVNFKTS